MLVVQITPEIILGDVRRAIQLVEENPRHYLRPGIREMPEAYVQKITRDNLRDILVTGFEAFEEIHLPCLREPWEKLRKELFWEQLEPEFPEWLVLPFQSLADREKKNNLTSQISDFFVRVAEVINIPQLWPANFSRALIKHLSEPSLEDVAGPPLVAIDGTENDEFPMLFPIKRFLNAG